jgi:MFS family permease
MADNALLVFLPLYLSETLRLNPVMVGLHVSLLTGLGIVTGPLLGGLSDKVGRKRVVLGVMGASAALAAGMGLLGQGVGLTVLVGMMGAILYAANPILQAAAMDIAEGLRLEGSMMGLMWGNNALFAAISPLILGLLAQHFGLGVVFWYALGLYLTGTALTLTL